MGRLHYFQPTQCGRLFMEEVIYFVGFFLIYRKYCKQWIRTIKQYSLAIQAHSYYAMQEDSSCGILKPIQQYTARWCGFTQTCMCLHIDQGVYCYILEHAWHKHIHAYIYIYIYIYKHTHIYECFDICGCCFNRVLESFRISNPHIRRLLHSRVESTVQIC